MSKHHVNGREFLKKFFVLPFRVTAHGSYRLRNNSDDS